MVDKNRINIINCVDEFVLTYIIEPHKKVYYVSSDENSIKCSTSILSAFRFRSRNNAVLYSESLDIQYGVKFSIEKVGV